LFMRIDFVPMLPEAFGRCKNGRCFRIFFIVDWLHDQNLFSRSKVQY